MGVISIKSMFTQRGMSTSMVVGAIVVLLLLAGGWYYLSSSQTPSEVMEEEQDAMMDDDAAMMDGTELKTMEDGTMMEADVDASMKGEASFRSAVIAGSSSPLLEFDQRDYTAALESDRVVVLYFYASWCPICKAEFEDTKAAFDAVTDDSIVGFRVHFNDSATTPEMEALAREYGVPYQHTKVFTKNGERVLKSPETWSIERYLSEFTKYSK